jgi:phosphoglycerate dehydrogenase-like enzyme
MPEIVVAVTEFQYQKGKSVFAAAPGLRCLPVPPAEPELAEAIRASGARHAIVGANFYRDGLYQSIPRGGVLSRYGVGHENIDKSKATQAGIFCTYTPGVLSDSVAEHTLLVMAAAARHLPTFTAAMRSGQWSPVGGAELKGKTLVIVGAGAIGRAVARIAAFGFGMRVLGVEIAPRPPYEGFESVSGDFDAAVAQADYVSLHIPGDAANANYLNADRLSRLPSHVWLINTARGSVVDEAALFDALSAARIRGAALDVFQHEPYRPVDEARDLRKLDNAILTPHVASNTADANRRVAERALRNIRLAEAGDFAAMDLLNREVLDPKRD